METDCQVGAHSGGRDPTYGNEAGVREGFPGEVPETPEMTPEEEGQGKGIFPSLPSQYSLPPRPARLTDL